MKSRLGVALLPLILSACASVFSLESNVSKETRKTREACEAAARAGQDTTTVCRAFLQP